MRLHAAGSMKAIAELARFALTAIVILIVAYCLGALLGVVALGFRVVTGT